MVEDNKYSEKEFDSEEEMHLYWAENHMDELNSHDKNKAKKALNKKENEKAAQREWRKKMVFRGTAGIVVIALVYLAAPSIAGLFTGGGSIDFDTLHLDEQPMLGSEDANVTVVEFGDYRCPACRQFEEQVKPDLMEHIENGDVNLYYLDYPRTVRPSSASENAAMAAQCVHNQDEGEFWNFHDALFNNQGQMNYDPSSLRTLAEQNTEGLDYDRLEQCIEDREQSDSLERDLSLARENGVTATPTVYVNGDRVSNWNNLANIIEENYL